MKNSKNELVPYIEREYKNLVVFPTTNNDMGKPKKPLVKWKEYKKTDIETIKKYKKSATSLAARTGYLSNFMVFDIESSQPYNIYIYILFFC